MRVLRVEGAPASAENRVIKLWASFFTRERLSDDLRLVVVVSNKAFGVDLGTAVPEGQVDEYLSRLMV